jgi:hypothetical protein
MTIQLRDGAGHIIPGAFTFGAHRNVATAATSARTAADFLDTTRLVRVVCTAACYIEFGDEDVVADNTGILVPALMDYLIPVPAGATRLAAIRVSGDGLLGVTEMR